MEFGYGISVDIPGLDVKEERDFSIMYGAFLSRSLFNICRKRSRATFGSGLLQCSFQLISCRSFLKFVSSKFLQHLCSLHVCSSCALVFALVEDYSIKNWIR